MTKKSPWSLGTVAISWLLILQIAVGSTLLSSPKAMANDPEGDGKTPSIVDQISRDGATDPATIEGRQATEEFAQEIENAREGDLPKNTPDAFRITRQTL